jgi:hypothetical protein
MPPLCCSYPLGQAWCPKLNHHPKVLRLLGIDLAFSLFRRRLNNHECNCLTLEWGKTYNIPDAEVAQVVEQRTENPRVSGSTPLLGTKHEVIAQNQISSRMPPCQGEVIENVGGQGFGGKCAEVAER